jgi:small nuclear ribonucleoprotein D3
MIQMKNGEIYRGLLLSAEDTMNMTLSDVLRTARNGQISKLPSVYLRGSSIRFIALPDLLKNAPVFQKVTTMKRKMEKELQQRQEGTFLCFFVVVHCILGIFSFEFSRSNMNPYLLWPLLFAGGMKRKRGD